MSIPVTRPSMPKFDEYVKEIKEIWDTQWLTNTGPKHQLFQKKLCEYLNVDSIELFTNGHMAIELTIQAFNLKGEIITTPFTFASTTHAIIRNGLEPVFCDIDSTNFTIDTTKLESLITTKTSAILPVHVYGNICNIEEIDRIAKKHGLIVIYDACHSFGEKYKGRGVGLYGDASCFSFHATKVFNSIEGGATSFKDQELGKRLAELRNFGIHGQEEVNDVGPNAKMNEFCAAMGLCNLKYVDTEINKRKKIVARYRDYLSGIPGIQLNVIQSEVQSNYAYFPVVFNKEKFGLNRDEVYEKLVVNDIFARKYFFPITNAFSVYKTRFNKDTTPVAERISRNVLTLPLYSDLSMDDVDKICQIVLDCYK